MEENLIRLILWLVFIVIWLIAGISKKRMDDRRVRSGEAPSAEELREHFGDNEPEEEPYVSQEDEFRKFLRTVTGVEPEKAGAREKASEKTPAARPRPQAPGPAAAEGEVPDSGAVQKQEIARIKRHPRPPVRGPEKLREAVVFFEILSPPRALRQYRAVKRDSFRQ